MSRRILSSREAALHVVTGYGADVITGQAPGISLADMIEVAINDAVTTAVELKADDLTLRKAAKLERENAELLEKVAALQEDRQDYVDGETAARRVAAVLLTILHRWMPLAERRVALLAEEASVAAHMSLEAMTRADQALKAEWAVLEKARGLVTPPLQIVLIDLPEPLIDLPEPCSVIASSGL
jgi:hypothetical protein